MDEEYVQYDDYILVNDTDENSTTFGTLHFSISHSSLAHVLAVVNVIISVLGLAGNLLVMWICGCKMKRSVINTWYISLAISDFIFCALLPLDVFYTITSHWPFGAALCKLTSSALFLNMYCSVFLLVLITVDRCIMISFPVWAHNHRSVRKAFAVVGVMWLISALLTLPNLIFRDTKPHGSIIQCYSDYMDRSTHQAVAATRFVCGFLIPFTIIVICSSVLVVKLRDRTLRSTRPYKVMAALILAFFLCWVPYHTFVLLELDLQDHDLDVVSNGLKVGATLAAANTFLSPVLYVFVGNDFKQTLKRSLTSRLEESMAEDFRTGGLSFSRARSMEVIQNKIIVHQ